MFFVIAFGPINVDKDAMNCYRDNVVIIASLKQSFKHYFRLSLDRS